MMKENTEISIQVAKRRALQYKAIWIAKKAIVYAILIGGGLVVLYPLIFMVMAGFYTAEEYNLTEIGIFPIPEYPTFKNFIAVFDPANYNTIGLYAFNSLARTVIVTVCTLLTTLLCGFTFARLHFPGKRIFFMALLFTSMIPGTVTMIPTFLLYAHWPFAGGNNVFSGGTGILDTWWVYVIGCPAINVMGTFFVKQYIETIPDAIDEAAKIDGAGSWRILFQIITPVVKPAMGYILITTALGVWGDWSTGFFFTSSEELTLLPAAITKLNVDASGGAVPDYPQMLTLGLACTIPSLIIYFIFQKNIIECVATAGLKD